MADSPDGDSTGSEQPEPAPLSVVARVERAHGGTVRAVEVIRGPDGATSGYLSGGGDGTLRTWNLDLTPRDSTPEPAHKGGVRAVAAIPGPQRTIVGYLSGGTDGTVRTWNLNLTPRGITNEPGPGGSVFSVAVITGTGGAATGYLSGGDDGILRTWEHDLRPRDVGTASEPGGGVFSVAVVTGPDGAARGYLSGGYDGILRTWDLDLRPRDTTEQADGGRVSSVAVINGPGGTTTGYLSGGDAGMLRTWNLDLTLRGTAERDSDAAIESVAVLNGPDGRTNGFLTGSDNGTVGTWNLDLTRRQTNRAADWVWSVSVITGRQGQADGYVTADDNGDLRAWDIELRPIDRTAEPAHGGSVQTVCLITGREGVPTGFLTGGHDGRLRTWDLDLGSGNVAAAHETGVRSIAALVGPDGRATGYISGGRDGTIRTWNLDLTGGETTRHHVSVRAIAVITGPDGWSGYATAGRDGTIRTWNRDLSEGTPRATHSDTFRSLVVIRAPSGETVGFMSGDGKGRLQTWGPDLTLRDATAEPVHRGGVRAVAVIYEPDGTASGYVSAGHDGHLRTWDLDLTPRLSNSGTHAQGSVYSVTVLTGRDGRPTGFVSGGVGGRIRTWSLDLNPRDWLQAHTGDLLSVVTIPGLGGATIGHLSGSSQGSLVISGAAQQKYQARETRNMISTADSVSTVDLIGRGPLVDHLVDVVEQLIQSTQDSSTQRGSCVIRIDAPWGSGKSTLLHLLDHGLRERKTTIGTPIIVEFDAWRESQVGPEWWSLGGALYRGIKAERVLSTRATMAATSALDRVVRSKVVVGAAVILAILAIALTLDSVDAFRTRWQVVITTVTGAVAAAIALSRILFWSSPALGQLHQKSDDAPLAEVARMVSKYRRWSPRQGTAHRLADTLLGTWLVLVSVWALTIGFGGDTEDVDLSLGWLVLTAIGVATVFLTVVVPNPSDDESPPSSSIWHRLRTPLTALGLAAVFVMVSGVGLWSSERIGARTAELADDNTWAWIIRTVLLGGVGLAVYIAWLRHSLGARRRPVLLAIDDLDRCTHEKTVAYLETIHTLIRHHTAPRFFPRWRDPCPLVVIVLADGRWVREAFTTQYDAFKNLGDEEVRSLGADFITKLFDHTVLIPELNEEQVKLYLDLLSDSEAVPSGEGGGSTHTTPDAADQAGAAVPPASTSQDPAAGRPPPEPGQDPDLGRSQDRDDPDPGADGPGKTPTPDELGAEEKVIELQQHLITRYAYVMPRNPRLIRRVANTWSMLEAVQASLNVDPSRPEAELVHAAIFFVRYPTLVDALLHSPATPEVQTLPWIRADILATRTLADGKLMSPVELAACYGKKFVGTTRAPSDM